MTASELWTMVKQAASDWLDDSASRLAAALAYYTIFSLAPLLVIAVVVMGTVMRNNNEAKEKVVSYVTSTAQGNRSQHHSDDGGYRQQAWVGNSGHDHRERDHHLRGLLVLHQPPELHRFDLGSEAQA
jgi:hypothetical protein